MRHFSLWSIALLLAGCAGPSPEIKRLSPIMGSSKAPAQCHVVSVLKNSPAEKTGITVGDTIRSVNGQVPTDASVFPDLVGAAPADSDFEISKGTGSVGHWKVHLSSGRPRLGVVCDLAGWEKPGITAAQNESVTVFGGPYAMTASGIIDKGILFLRIRLSNNSDRVLQVGPELFDAKDSYGTSLAVMSPKDVMCFLYGDKGAHLLALKKKHKETLDAHESIPAQNATPEEHCEGGAKGRLSNSDPQFAEANAQYMAAESLWPATYQPGTVADGLIYVKETSNLPVTLTASVEGTTLAAKLGVPKGSEKQMKPSELVQFFESQKKGTSLRLTLKRGKVFVGRFSSYDPIDERAWFDSPSGGMLNSTSHSLENIRYAEPLEQVPAKPTPTSSDLN